MFNEVLSQVAVVLFIGLIAGYAIRFLNLPSVTGYLLAGVIIGPHILGLVTQDSIEIFSLFSTAALGFISFVIGSEFNLKYLKRVGATPIVIAFAEAFVAAIFVTVALVLVGVDLSMALVMGAIASATAPASIIMVIKQYKARGPVSKMLLSVVAIDDVASLITFGFAISIAKSLQGADVSALSMIIEPLKEMGLSIVVGVVAGLLLAIIMRNMRGKSNRLIAIVAIILAILGVAEHIEASPLLACMICGAIFTNVGARVRESVDQLEVFAPPFYVMFFVLSGAMLDLGVIPAVGLLTLVYVIARTAGKYAGVYLGSIVMKAENNVKKYLGFALLPKAGVAIGLSLIAQHTLPQYAAQINGIVLASTLIFELSGPVLAKEVFKKIKEIEPEAQVEKEVAQTNKKLKDVIV